jgi:DNA-3-methyladenine glycosylase
MKPRSQTLPRIFYERPPECVAPDLLGKILVRGPLRGRIVETEAYAEDDPASHSFGGFRSRNATLFGSPGHLEVYLTYGIHHLANVVCQPTGVGAGVLLRALSPLAGIETMRERRRNPRSPDHLLCSGPGRLCQAFALGRAENATDLVHGQIRILDDGVAPPIAASTRVGLTTGRELAWRFYVPGDPSVSRVRADLQQRSRSRGAPGHRRQL